MKRLSVYSVLLISVIPIVLLMPVFLRDITRDVQVYHALPSAEQWLIAVVAVTSTLGALFLYMAVSSRNATLASLIEITYPVFVVFFACLFFRQLQINLSVIAGGILILIGAGLIIYNNR